MTASRLKSFRRLRFSVGEVVHAEIGQHGAGLGAGALHAGAAGERGKHERRRRVLGRHLGHDGVDGLGHLRDVLIVEVRAPGDVGEGAHEALVVVEGGHLEVGHGNARAHKRVAQIGLAGIAAAAAGAARHDDEVGVKRHDGLQVHCREVPHRGHIRTLDGPTGRLERIIGDAHERAPSQLPGVREAAMQATTRWGLSTVTSLPASSVKVTGPGAVASAAGASGACCSCRVASAAGASLSCWPASGQRQRQRRRSSAQYKLLQNKILSIQKLTGSPKEVSEVATGA